MTTYTFNADANEQLVNWNNPSVWVGGVVPDSPDAMVVIPTVYTVQTEQVFSFYITLTGSYDVESVTIANNELSVYGSLAVAGDFSAGQGSGVELDDGLLSFDTFENDSAYLQGYGQMDGSGLFTNDAEVDGDGDGLTLTLAALTNNGTLLAASGDLTVDVRAGGFTNISSGVLTGGTYQADAGVLYLNIGGAIATDAASIYMGDGGAIDYYDDASQQYVTIQSSLDLVASTGQLTLAKGTYDFPDLTVDGALTLLRGTLTSANLVVGPTGRIADEGELLDGSSVQGGTLSGAIVDNGAIVAGPTGGGQTTGDDLVIAGSLSGDSAVQIAAGLWTEGILRSGETFSDAGGGALELQGAVSDNVDFSGDLGMLIVDHPATFTGAVATDGADDKIELPGVSLSSVVSYSYAQNSGGGVLTIDCGAVSYNLAFVGNFDKADFALSPGPQQLSSSPPSLLISNSGSPSIAFTNFSDDDSLLQTIDGTVDAADAGRPVSFYDGSTLLETVATAANGQFSAAITLSPTLGEHFITARVTGATGNTGISDPIDFRATAPVVTIASAAPLPDQASQTISGTIVPADAGLTISIYDGSTLLGTTTANSAGAWTANVTLPASGPYVLTAQATLDDATSSSNAVDLASSGGQSLGFTGITDAASLYDTAGDFDVVGGVGGTIYLTSAQVEAFNTGGAIDFAGGSGDAAAIYSTGVDWDSVNGDNGLVVLTKANAEVTGGGDAVYFEGSGENAAALYNTGVNWDAVNGSGGEVVLTAAFAEVTGGGNAIYFEGASGNAAALYNTGGVFDAIAGSNGEVVLTAAFAEVIGGGDAVYFEGTSANIAALYNTGGAFDGVTGSNGEVVLTNAQAEVVGGGNSIYLEGAAANTAALYNTGTNADAVTGSNGLLVLTNTQATITGSGDAVYLVGANTVTQNGASDAFVFQPTIGEDTINGFAATDTMQFSASDFANFAALQSHTSQSGANTVITLNASDTVTLTNVLATSLSASQFHFV